MTGKACVMTAEDRDRVAARRDRARRREVVLAELAAAAAARARRGLRIRPPASLPLPSRSTR